MFIERLTESQVTELLEIISQRIRTVTKITKIKRELGVHIENSDEIVCKFSSWWNKKHSVHCIFCDFHVEVLNPNEACCCLEYEIKLAFWEFMCTVFGEEYKKAYLARKAVIARRSNSKEI